MPVLSAVSEVILTGIEIQASKIEATRTISGTMESLLITGTDLERKKTVDSTSTSDLENALGSSRSQLETTQGKSQPVKHKHRLQCCVKFLGLPVCIVFTIFFVSYIMLFGWPGSVE